MLSLHVRSARDKADTCKLEGGCTECFSAARLCSGVYSSWTDCRRGCLDEGVSSTYCTFSFPPETPVQKGNGEGRQGGRPQALKGAILVGLEIRKSEVPIPVVLMLPLGAWSKLLNLSVLRFARSHRRGNACFLTLLSTWLCWR